MNTEHSDHENTKTISQDSKRDHEEDEEGSIPWAMQEHVRRQNACDEQHPARTNATAFLCYFKANPGQLEY